MIRRTEGPEAAVVTADLARQTSDPVRKRQVLATLARKLDGAGREARDHAKVAEVIEAALKEPDHPDRRDPAGRRHPRGASRGRARGLRRGHERPGRGPRGRHRGPGRAPAVGEPGADGSTDRRGEGEAQLEPGRRGRRAHALPARRGGPDPVGIDHEPRVSAGPSPPGPADVRPAWRRCARRDQAGQGGEAPGRPEDRGHHAGQHAPRRQDPRARRRASCPCPSRRPAAPCPPSSSWSAARGRPTAVARSSSGRAPTVAEAATASRGRASGSGPTCRRSGRSTGAMSCCARS